MATENKPSEFKNPVTPPRLFSKRVAEASGATF